MKIKFGLYHLSKSFINKLIKVKDIKNLLKEKIDEELFLYSYDYVVILINFFTFMAK